MYSSGTCGSPKSYESTLFKKNNVHTAWPKIIFVLYLICTMSYTDVYLQQFMTFRYLQH